jgi:hypothetical protein
MLAAAMDKKEKKSLAQKEIDCSTETSISPSVFSGMLLQQHKEMMELHAAIVAQEKRLIQHCEAKKEHDLESLNTQDILRDRIKEIEQSYLELKQNFTKYFSTII